jgi:hypothetical protein
MEGGQLGNAIEVARERYADKYVVRAAVQAIPWIGGSLDTLVTGGIARIQLQRVEDFLAELNLRMQLVERAAANLEDDAFSDFVFAALESAARARSQEKRSRLAQVIRRQVEDALPWDDADNALRLTGTLEEMHFRVLGAVMSAPVLGEPFNGLRVVALEPQVQEGASRSMAMDLNAALQEYDLATLRLACSELVARGLLRDEGVGRIGTKAMNYFVATDLAQWLDGWLSSD